MSGAPADPPGMVPPDLHPDPRRQQAVLVESLRRYGAVHADLMRSFAEHLTLHPIDATALSEILFADDGGAPLTPAALARRIGRSRPATTALVGRLVAQGYVERVPHPDDGRAVILKGAARVGEATATFFIPYAAALDRVLAAHDPAAVDRSVALLDEVTAAIRDLVKR